MNVVPNPGTADLAKLFTTTRLGLTGAYTISAVLKSLNKSSAAIIGTPARSIMRIANGNWQLLETGSTDTPGSDGWSLVTAVVAGLSSALNVDGVAVGPGAITAVGAFGDSTLEILGSMTAQVDVENINVWPFALNNGQAAAQRAAMKAGYSVLA